MNALSGALTASSTIGDGGIALTDLRLADSVRDALAERLHDALGDPFPPLDTDVDAAILARIGVHALRRTLPTAVLDELAGFTRDSSDVLVLSNLPQQEFPPTPVSGFGEETELSLVNSLQLGLISLLGLTPYAVDYENSGKLIRNVVPNPEAAGKTSSWGADTEFFWHTDNPHLPFGQAGLDPRPFPPRFLTFYAVRNVEQVATEFVGVDVALEGLPEDVLERLSANEFLVAAPDSNDVKSDGRRIALEGTAVLQRAPEGVLMRYDRGTTRGMNAEAERALDILSEQLARKPAFAPVLQPGQFLIFDNYRALHRRKAFDPAPSEVARWLRRCYAS
ncbi:TauD/TfdA family dioxygenase [Kitasatospora sp. NPDC059795]|uniref:TauD/TfdA family dioxygenase n=1 Tax=Kitasatospora sp. NPDC059795 TaxID=3346949 RepID=UPI003653ACB4